MPPRIVVIARASVVRRLDPVDGLVDEPIEPQGIGTQGVHLAGVRGEVVMRMGLGH